MAAALVEGIVQDAGSWLARLDAPKAWLVQQDDELTGGLSAGDLEELQLCGSSTTRAVRVIAVDTISVPNRARVEVVGSGKVMVVPVVSPEEAARWSLEDQDEGAAEHTETPMVNANQTTIYQDYDDAFFLAKEKVVDVAVAAEEQRLRPATDAPEVVPAVLASGGELLQTLRKGISMELKATMEDIRDLSEDLKGFAAGAVDVAANGKNALFPPPAAPQAGA